jgi:hypothetical protein
MGLLVKVIEFNFGQYWFYIHPTSDEGQIETNATIRTGESEGISENVGHKIYNTYMVYKTSNKSQLNVSCKLDNKLCIFQTAKLKYL